MDISALHWGNINDMKKLVKVIRADPGHLAAVWLLCDWAMQMRLEIEARRTQESARVAKEREALVNTWAAERGMLTRPGVEHGQKDMKL